MQLGRPGMHTFFGYYDLIPFHKDGSRVLAMQVPRSTQTSRTPARFGYFDLRDANSAFAELGETWAWCWQQGSRLQWMPGTDNAVFTNALINERYAGHVVDAGTGATIQVFSRPLYHISADGRYGLTLDFSRLQRLRPGYGYDDLQKHVPGEKAPDNNGVWLIDIATGQESLLLSLAEAASMKPHDGMADAVHYFNHLCWNPSGKRFMVFHIWHGCDGKRRIRIISGDRQGRKRLVTNGAHMSHYWWLTNDRLLVYGTPEGRRTPSYYVLHDGETESPAEDWSDLMPAGDGHPSQSRCGAWVVTDTLPDRMAERSLCLLDRCARRMHRVCSFYSPPRFSGERRCDLHPRFSPDARHVAVDSAHAGYRQLVVVDIGSLTGEGMAA